MRAIQITSFGGPDVLTPSDLPVPEPGDGQAQVRVAASGVNYIDTYQRTGAYQVPLPFVPGLEGAGTITALGAGVDGLAVGDRVAWAMMSGSYAEYAALPANRLVRVPDDLDDQTAAACMLQGMTAHYLTVSTYAVQPGDAVLVHAAAGGMGLLLTQWCRARGATVIGTASTAEKAELAREAGAAVVINYTEVDDLAAEVRRLTNGAGVAVAYDGVGATTFDASLASLRRRGTLALYGAASGPVPPVDPQRLNAAGSVFLTRPTLADHVDVPDELSWRATEVFEALRSGTLHITVGGSYRLEDAAAAHTDLQSRRTTGKLLLQPG